jgi:hypothetical protein
MKKFVLVVLAALSISISGAVAQDLKPLAKAEVGMINPQIIADVDVFALEDEAETRWKNVLPRLQENVSDYYSAWRRINTRLNDAAARWREIFYSSADSRKDEEMKDWCSASSFESLAPAYDDSASKKFAQLEVRTKLCEDKLSKKPKVVSVPGPSGGYSSEPYSYGESYKPAKTKKRK